jgi:hypothetical protein
MGSMMMGVWLTLLYFTLSLITNSVPKDSHNAITYTASVPYILFSSEDGKSITHRLRFK